MMNLNDIQPIVMVYHRKLATVSLQFKRYLYAQINWQVRLVGIKGARGVGKTFSQIADIPNSFLAVDNMEIGSGCKIPLWLFGMMY